MNNWYIDRSKNFVYDTLLDCLKVFYSASRNRESMNVNELINLIRQHPELNIAEANINAALTRFRDHGLLRNNNILGDSAIDYVEGRLSESELIVDLFLKRPASKYNSVDIKPFVILCKVFDIMIDMLQDVDDIFITSYECKEYLCNINDINEITYEYVEKIINNRNYSLGSNMPVPRVAFDTNEDTNFSIWFNALNSTPIFIKEDSRRMLRPNIKQKEFFKYISVNSDEFTVTPTDSKNSLYSYYCDRKTGINEILPNIVKDNLTQIEKDDIKAIFDYLFGYKRNFKVDYEKYFNKECFGIFFPFITLPGLAIRKIYIENKKMGQYLYEYISNRIIYDDYLRMFNDNLFEYNNLNSNNLIEKNKMLKEYEKFYINNIENLKNSNDSLEAIKLRKEFLEEYPIEKIKNLSLDEYALGTTNFKNTLSYKLEFGKYKYCGASIGGGTAAKHGIYLKEDGNYYGKNNLKIDNVENYWHKFRFELFDFLSKIENMESLKGVLEKYELITSIPAVLTKLCFIYYPNKFVNYCSREKLLIMMDAFEFIYDKNLYAPELSFEMSKQIKSSISVVCENDPQYIGDTLWRFFIDMNENKIEENEQKKNEFQNWLYEQGLASATIRNYISSISITSKEAIEDGVLNKSIYNIDNLQELIDIMERLNQNEKFIFRKDNYNNINTAALSNYQKFLESKIDANNQNNYEKYDKDDFLNDVFIDENKYDSLVSILEKKKNIILEGAPGVGKTFMAKRLAYSILGCKDKSKVKLIQFHQSYSYEDFIEGYRPTETGFKLYKGIFYNLCKEASKKDNKNKKYYIIIDEINRGNLSKIFGELLMLIESDKRNETLTLAYSNEEFSVPDNLYIIGLMNTADRSLALIDYALRRRFSFIRIEPAFDNPKFIESFKNKFDQDFDNVIEIIKKINDAITNDKSLGAGFKIGHSYFCPNLKDRKGNKKDIEDIVIYEIIPLLEEYWYDDEDSLIQWQNELYGVIND